MRKRVPVAREERPPVPEFTPVPRKYRHDGWTPERQKAFIEALADCGSVSRAAAQVNMAQANCYTLRRAPGAESFRKAWEAALDFAVLRLKDIAFERAIEGQLFPVFKNGKLMGFNRKKNDALLMFCLRHYGQDAGGKRTTINYFSTKATAGAAAGVAQTEGAPPPPRIESGAVPLPERAPGGSVAEASTTTVRTVINGAGGPGVDADAAAGVLNGFDGLTLDAEAHAAIAAALEDCAARARAANEATGEAARELEADDPDQPFVREPDDSWAWRGELVPPGEFVEWQPFTEGEGEWQLTGADMPDWQALQAPEPDKLCDNSPVAPQQRKADNRLT